MLEQLGRIRVRLLIVNLVVLLVPIAGLEFARLYERQLLSSLERDMRNQATLVRETLEARLEDGETLDDARVQRVLVASARQTRTRIRVLDASGAGVLDSHAEGPPEGPEPPAPTILPGSAYAVARSSSDVSAETSPDVVEMWSARSIPREVWPPVPQRREVRSALRGHPDAYTRVRDRAPAVLLFVTEPIRSGGDVAGVVYVTRSTRPVLTELYRIRRGLIQVLVVAVIFTLLLTLVLAWSISRPLSRLARAARRIAAGERGVEVPVGGSGEIRELGEAFDTMTRELDARMRYTSEFAADVAHELKSPLTSIRGAAELLQEGAADDAEARARFTSNIQLDAERLDRLVNRLLELSRIDSRQLPMEPVDLAAVVDRVIARTHTPEQPVEVEWQTSRRELQGREEDLERALLNLVENAVRFSPGGVPVMVTIAEEPSGRGRSVVTIRVTDRGPGIPTSHREKVFDRFFTTDADRSGTGLGLAIVRSVARAHGGDATQRETPGGGATFEISLPQ